MAKVFIPALMRKMSDDLHVVDVPGKTLRAVVNNLDQQHPGMKALIVENDKVRPGLQLAVDGIISATGLMAHVPEEAEVHILPALGGG
jgi:molybdopterin synthase sulfur carrier subunit